MEREANCTLLIAERADKTGQEFDINKMLESKKMEHKCDALKRLLVMAVNGERAQANNHLMRVIQHCVTCSDHYVKKLLLLYWEIVDTLDEKGEAKPELILIVNAVRNDIQHPNEYVRGRTMRLLCKLDRYELIEPMVEPILQNLDNRHPFVRRNAVMCLYAIVSNFGLDKIPTAIDDIDRVWTTETDLNTKRNAFVFLQHCAPELAFQHLLYGFVF